MSEQRLSRYVTFAFWQQWGELFFPWRYNWAEFSFVKLECEYEPVGPCFVLKVALIGFNASLSIALPWKTQQQAQVMAALEEMLADKEGKHGE